MTIKEILSALKDWCEKTFTKKSDSELLKINIHPSKATIDSDFEETFGKSIVELLDKGYTYYSDEENYRNYYFAISGNTISESEGDEIIKFDDSETIYSIVVYKHDETDPETEESINVETISAVSSEPKCLFEPGTGTNSVQQKGTGASAVSPSAVAEGGDNLEGGEPASGEEKLYSKAEGYASHAEGAAHAIGRYSHAEGGGNSVESGHPTRSTAEGAYSHAEGTHTHAIGNGSHAEGHLTIANSPASHAEGRLTIAGIDKDNGKYAHAEGFEATASGQSSHAEGTGTTASGINSHAEGNGTTAQGLHSHAEGSNNTASGESSHTEGAQTSASANHSHAGGFASEVSSPRGFVHGRNVEAKSNVEGQFAVGKYNKSNTNQILSVGIGTGTAEAQRKNAFEIMQNGDIYVYHIGGYNGDNISSATTLQNSITNAPFIVTGAVYTTDPFNPDTTAIDLKLPNGVTLSDVKTAFNSGKPILFKDTIVYTATYSSWTVFATAINEQQDLISIGGWPVASLVEADE